jgi:hypothetical protein
MLHGHCVVEAVLKLQEYGLLIVAPAVLCAPDTVAVKVAPAASEFVGLNVAMVSALSKLSEPATSLPLESLSVNDTLLGTTASENVAAGAASTESPVEPAVGDTVVTVGGCDVSKVTSTP